MAEAARSRRSLRPAPVDATFKMIFATVTLMTVALIALDAAFALVCAEPTPSQARLLETADSFAKIGMGVLFGLLGGSIEGGARRPAAGPDPGFDPREGAR